MTTTTGAETESQDDASKQGAAPPAGESQGDGGKAPGDDWVSKKQFLAALSNASATAEQLRAENAALKAAQSKATETKPPTRVELQSLVNAGELTQEQADAIWDKQLVERAKREAVAEIDKTHGARERQSRVKADLLGYKELVPEAWVEGSPERAKAMKEFKYLTDLGDPSTEETEAKALRAAFGDIEALRASKSARSGPADTHSETGGSKPPSGGGGKNDVLKTLSAREKDYYETKIKQGIYRDWKAVAAELEFANPAARRKMGAKV